jgi:hypothetical protein
MKIMYQLATLHGLYEALILTTESKNWTEAKMGLAALAAWCT